VQKQLGFTMFEAMLALAIIAIAVLAVVDRFGIKKDYYQWTKNVAQVQASVAQLLQAGNIYFYVNCANTATPIGPMALTAQNLITAGGLGNATAFTNPWGANYTVSIVSANNNAGPPYAIKVTGNFNQISQAMAGQLAQVLNADPWAGANTLTWTQLPNLATANLGTWYASPGNYVASNNAGNYGGVAINSKFWVMNAGLDYYTSAQNTAMKKPVGACLNLGA
jgi:Tfp pilus assembly protein PilV